MKRRAFLTGAIGAGIALGASRQLLARQAAQAGSGPKRILVLGGTGFIGPRSTA